MPLLEEWDAEKAEQIRETNKKIEQLWGEFLNLAKFLNAKKENKGVFFLISEDYLSQISKIKTPRISTDYRAT